MAVYAGKVTEQQALLKARQFMQGKTLESPQKARGREGTPQSTDAFYIFNVKDNDGFVIISGDDRTVPIIGYSDHGSLCLDDMPDNLRAWLDGYAAQLSAIEEGRATPAVRRTLGSEMPAIAPLIQTKWNQYSPYNLMTPTYTDGEGNVKHYVTGCVATAVAQVLYYYQWPKSCPAIPAYTTSTLGLSLSELSATTFKWDQMQLEYDYDKNTDFSLATPGGQAVAELMRYVGQALKMDYNIGGSGAYVNRVVMISTFGYSKNMQSISRSNYTTAEWESLIYQELKAKRPVLYDGNSGNAGHQFICDGYNGEGLFHLNWGWGGGSDGFFVLSLANPSEKGIGGGNGTGGYAFGQGAILGFQPAVDNEPEVPIFVLSTEYVTPASYTRASDDADFENINIKKYSFSARYIYTPTTTYPVEVGWALWQDGELLKVVETQNLTIDNGTSTSRYYSLPETVNFGAGLPDGKYRLLLV